MPKSDPAARAVLAYLAVRADGSGRNAHPLALSIAHDVGLNPEVVPRVLKRLVDYGLISKDGVGPQGQPRWTLHTDRRHPEGSFEEFVTRHQSGRAQRQSRWRSKSSVDEPGSPTRDDFESSTTSPVDDDASSQRRSLVVSETTIDRHVDDSKYPQKSPLDQSTSVLDQSVADAAAPPETDQLFDVPATPTKPSAVDLDATFDRFWVPYPRKDNKANARKAWTKAAKKHGAEFLIAEAERWAALWTAAGRERQYIPMPTTWLNGERWTDEPPTPRAANGNGQHVPYRDPADEDVYDQPLQA